MGTGLGGAGTAPPPADPSPAASPSTSGGGVAGAVVEVVGAVLLSRRSGRRSEEIVDPGQAEHEEEIAERMAEATRRAHPELEGDGPRPFPRTGPDSDEART